MQEKHVYRTSTSVTAYKTRHTLALYGLTNTGRVIASHCPACWYGRHGHGRGNLRKEEQASFPRTLPRDGASKTDRAALWHGVHAEDWLCCVTIGMAGASDS